VASPARHRRAVARGSKSRCPPRQRKPGTPHRERRQQGEKSQPEVADRRLPAHHPDGPLRSERPELAMRVQTAAGQTTRQFTCEGESLPGATRLASDFSAKIRTPGAYAIWSNAVHAGWSAITADWDPVTMVRATHRESLWAAAINATACAMDPCHDALVHLGLNARLAQWNRGHIRNRRTLQRMSLPSDWARTR
jgi:hypothetical protein